MKRILEALKNLTTIINKVEIEVGTFSNVNTTTGLETHTIQLKKTFTKVPIILLTCSGAAGYCNRYRV